MATALGCAHPPHATSVSGMPDPVKTANPIQVARAMSRMSWPLLASAAAIGVVAGLARQTRPAPEAARPARDGASLSGPGRADKPQALQHARALEPGRGRHADAPHEVPVRGWKDILWRTYEQVQQDRLLAVAAGVAFYALLAIFPAITALVSLYGLAFEPATVVEHLSVAATVLPPGGFEIVNDQVDRVISASGGGLTLGFLAGVGIALWSANNGVKAIFDALNVIYDEGEKRSFVMLNLISLGFTLGGILLFLLFVWVVAIAPLLFAQVGLTSAWEWLLPFMRWPVLFAAVLVALALVYRFGPSRVKAEWRWISVGSLFATIAWIAGSLLFSWYLQNFGNYNAVYGSLGAVIGLMMWLWLSAVVVLIGGELNAEIEHQTARDTTVGGGKPLGTRGAAMADSVGEAKA